MAKELPFFKFTANEWLTGDINYEPFEIQGLFITVCSTYWSKDCNISLAKLKQRLSNAKAEQWDYLINEGYIKVVDGQVFISFLDEQMNELSEQHAKRVEAGRKGGLSKAKAKLKHKDIDIEVDKEKDKELREKNFREQVAQYTQYPKETLEAFSDYWTESNPNGKKMKFEMQKTFDIGRRLKTWNRNNFIKTKEEESNHIDYDTIDYTKGLIK